MMKRIFAAVLFVLMIAVLFAGCARTYWTDDRPYNANTNSNVTSSPDGSTTYGTYPNGNTTNRTNDNNDNNGTNGNNNNGINPNWPMATNNAGNRTENNTTGTR